MVTQLINRAVFGFVLGMVVGVLVVIGMSYADGGGSLVLPNVLLEMMGSEAGALLVQMLSSGAFGAIPMAGTVLYEIGSWGLLKQAVVHYVSYTVAFLLLGIFLGWFEPTIVDLGTMAGVFAVCHCAIWLVMYARYRSEAKRLNELLGKVRM